MIRHKTFKFKRKTPDYIKRTCILLIVLISFFAIIIRPTYTYCANSTLIEMKI